MTTIRSIGPRLCVALTLSMGFALVFSIASGWLYLTGLSLSGRESPQIGQQPVVLPGGRPALERATYSREAAWSYAYSTLDGTAISDPIDREFIIRGNSLWPRAPEFATAGPGLRSRVTVAATTGAEHWYYVAYRMGKSGLAYFAGYETQSRRSIGYFGRNGFQSTVPTPDEMFPANTMRTHGGIFFNTWVNTGIGLQPAHFFVLSDNRLLQIDPATRSLTPVVERAQIPDAAPLGKITWSTLAGVTVRAQPILLRTPQSVIVFDPADETSREYTLPAECRDRYITFVPVDEQQAVVEAWGDFEEGPLERNDVHLFNTRGQLLASHRGAIERTGFAVEQETLVAACVVPAPIVTMLLTAAAPLDELFRPTTFAAALKNAWLAFVVTGIVGLLAVLAARRHLRKCRVQPEMPWLTFVFLFGLPGYVGYRLHRRFPRPEPIPPPERLGYEVFA